MAYPECRTECGRSLKFQMSSIRSERPATARSTTGYRTGGCPLKQGRSFGRDRVLGIAQVRAKKRWRRQ
jgi:hypothetical protein